MIFDIGWLTTLIYANGNSQSSSSASAIRASRASRLGAKASRIVRIIRIIRFVKLYKQAQILLEKELQKQGPSGEEDDRLLKKKRTKVTNVEENPNRIDDSGIIQNI